MFKTFNSDICGILYVCCIELNLGISVVSDVLMHTQYRSVCVLSHFSRVQLFATPWTVALQAPLSEGFSRQEYWSGLPCCPPGDLPDPGVESRSPVDPALQVDSLPLSHRGNPKVHGNTYM